MLRRDFMMRQLEEWARLMGYILSLRKDGKFREAESNLDDLIEVAGPPNLPENAPFTDFLDSMDRGGIVDSDHLILFGNALLEKYRLQSEKIGIPLDQLDLLGNKALYVLLLGILENLAVFRMSEIAAVKSLSVQLPQIEPRTTPLLNRFLEEFGE